MVVDSVLIIFAKAPVAGEVNTRLIPHLGVEQATALQQQLIELRLSQFGHAMTFDVQLHCAPDTRHAYFQPLAESYDITCEQQHGIDLGQRMSHALQQGLQRYARAVLIGTDAPVVDVSVVQQAFDELDAHDVVLQPAEDGGYVLIAMRKHHAAVFQTVAWGTDRVLTKTRANIVAAGLKWKELATAWDIDTYEDYKRWKSLSSDG